MKLPAWACYFVAAELQTHNSKDYSVVSILMLLIPQLQDSTVKGMGLFFE